MPVLKIPALKNAGTGKGQKWKMDVLSVVMENELLFFFFTLFRVRGAFYITPR